MKIEKITSYRNSKIKELLALRDKGSLRREKSYFVLEGERELRHCLSGGIKSSEVFGRFKLRTAFVCPEIIGEENYASLLKVFSLSNPNAGVIEVTPGLYEKIAYRGGTEGVVAEVEYRNMQLSDLQLRDNPLVVVLESVEKPGNLGAVLRSADAAGADAVIICDPRTDLYNPNLIRASIGSIFTVQTVAVSSEQAIKWLKENDIAILTAQLQDSRLYYDVPMTGGTAIVMGTEADGLTDIWRENADAHIRIPMNGKLDSLNVSVSAAILLYEAVRQRN